MKARIIVTTFIEKDGKILLGKKPDNVGPYPNAWHFPGGGVRLEEESLEEAVRREIKEETGLKIEKMERVSFDEDYEPDKHGEKTHYVFLAYKVIPLSMDVRASDDIVKLEWFDKSELQMLLLPRPSIKLLQEIGWL